MATLRETAEEVLEVTATEFDNRHGTYTPLPDLNILEGRAHFRDRDEYALNLGEEGFQNSDGSRGPWNEENLRIFFENELQNLYSDAALIVARQNGEYLLDIYSEATELRDPELDISGGLVFRDQDNLGEFNKKDNFIGLNYSLMKDINPKTLELVGDTIEPIITHENTHALWFTTNPIYRPLIEQEVVGETDNFQRDIGRAPVEAITMYEQFKNHPEHFEKSNSHFQIIEAFRNPRKIPKLQINPERNTYYLQDPYAFGTMGAIALEEAMKEKETVRDPEAATRRKLLDDNHPMYVKDNVDRFFEEKGLSNYPELYQKNFNWLSNRPEDRRNAAYKTQRDRIHEAYDEETGNSLSYFLELRALKNAYRNVTQSQSS